MIRPRTDRIKAILLGSDEFVEEALADLAELEREIVAPHYLDRDGEDNCAKVAAHWERRAEREHDWVHRLEDLLEQKDEALRSLFEWAVRMPDAGFTDASPRWAWWYDGTPVRDYARAALAASAESLGSLAEEARKPGAQKLIRALRDGFAEPQGDA